MDRLAVQLPKPIFPRNTGVKISTWSIRSNLCEFSCLEEVFKPGVHLKQYHFPCAFILGEEEIKTNFLLCCMITQLLFQGQLTSL